MKKLLTVLLSVVAIGCVTAGVACSSHTHTWVATDETDENGNVVYVCDCGETHEHTFSSAWSSDETAHWHAATCEHSDAVSGYEEHMFDDDGVCEVCGYAQSSEYEILFAYYTDDNGDGAYDSNGAYDDDGNTVYDTYRGVIYTAVEYNGITVNTDGDTLQAGETFAFTVKKSVYCEYTDSRNYALVTVVYETEDGTLDDYNVEPDDNGVYYVTVENNTVITVTNVEDMDITISGSGTESNPYTIYTVMDWLYFASIINDKDWYGISYNFAYWQLANDLDFEGEEAYIIGDGYTTTYSMFMGNFDGGNNTIKNLVISNDVYGSEGEYSIYVGVFGILSGYAGVDTCIKNLNIENLTITAGASADSAVSVGGVVGYVAGASVINCNVLNSTLTVNADDDYSAFAGGITGLCQSGYSESEGIIFYASIQYCSADVDISGSGYLYEMGGIVGRAMPYGAVSPVFIYNCYSNGVYTDSVHCGGIAGYVGRYTSVQNCYSTAEITTASEQTNITSGYENTVYDYRYSYAGGIVGYAENDTVIANCFYAGASLSASAVAGTSYGVTGDIVAGYSAAGFEDYRASAVLLSNNISGTTAVTDDVIKNTLGWNEIDWVFSGNGRPTINTESAEYEFTITVKAGTETYTYTIDSLYRPMAYWYLQAESDSSLLPEYLSSGSNRTYGYYFDSALTERVPLCYVPMDSITIYAGYSNYSEVAGVYMISSNGITATLTLETDGTYELSYGARYLSGSYEYNGEYVTMAESYFARFVSSATTTQQETSFKFWAELNDDGDLEIYDCETLFEVSETYDSYGYTYLARILTKDSPLVAVAKANTEVCGKYYDADDSDNVFTLVVGYTGSAVINGASRTVTYYYENGTLYVVMNGVAYTAVVGSGKITALKNSAGTTVYSLVAYDDFEGTWEQSATIDKQYTFDGKGGWTYYVDGVLASSGSYTVNSNGALTFTRGGITVTVTLNSDGTLNVKESSGSVAVTYYGEGGYQGTWYTAAISGNKYTLELSGILGSGSGTLSLSGAGVSLTDLPYISENGVLYAYSGDTLYAMLTYDESTGTMTGLFYDSTADALSTSYLFYLYDNFQGEWFSDISGLEKLTFNGMGAYNVAAADEDSIAVRGKVTINDSSKTVQYYLNDSGEYEFVYNSVTYIMEYDENNNEVTVTYGGTTAKLIAGDSLYGVVYSADGETYTFNGAGNLSTGGTVTISGTDVKSAVYVINSSTGVVTVTYNGATYATFTPVKDADGDVTGYTVTKSGATCQATVVNDFTGAWVIVGAYATITVPEISYYESGSVIELMVYYTSEDYNNVAIDACYDGSVMWIYLDSSTIYYISNIYGSMFMSTTYDATDDDDAFSLVEYDGWLAFYENADGDTVALGGDSNYTYSYTYNGTKYTFENYGNATVTIDGVESNYMYKVDESGNITIYIDEETEDADGNTVIEVVAVYTFNVSANGEYEYNGENRALVEAK